MFDPYIRYFHYIMTSIQDLFSEAASARVDSSTRGAEAEQRLAALVGSSRPVFAAHPVEDDTASLQRVVGQGGRVVETVGEAPPPSRIRRTGAARDWVNIAVSIVAVIAVASAALIAGAVAASASPEKSALESLSDVEGRLVDARESTNRAIISAAALQEEILVGAEGLPDALGALSGLSDEPSRAAAEQIRASVVETVHAIELPAAFPPYRRSTIDTSSLAEIGSAIDGVGELQLEVKPVVTDVTRVSKSLRDANDKLVTALGALVATVPASAAALVAEAPDIEETYRTAVTDAAGIVAGSDLLTTAGRAAVGAYAEAVAAMRAESDRVAEEERLRIATQRTPYWNNSGGAGTDNDADAEVPTSPDVTPVDPAPEPTEPVEPTPTDPQTPAPDPSAAAEG